MVTGAAGGQGAAEAALLAQEGATVIGVDVKAPATPIRGVEHRELDVADPGAWRALAESLRASHPAVHGLVNNAAITNRVRLADVSAEEMARVYAINCIGPVLGMQALAPLMPSGGSIVNVCSIAATTGHYPPAYTASKWALRGISRAASAELGRAGIRVNAIMPGFVVTPMTRDAPEAFLRLSIDEIPLARSGTPEDVAPLVVFLISDEAGWISGAEIAVDGGQAGHGGMKRLSDAARAATSTNPNQEETR